MPTNTYSRLQLRRGDKSWWDNHKGIVLLDGEPGVELVKNGDKVVKTRLKIGDGKTAWGKLGYLAGSGGGSSASTISITSVETDTGSKLNTGSSIFEYNSDIPKITFKLKVTGDINSVQVNGSSLAISDDSTVNYIYSGGDKLTSTVTLTFKCTDFDDKECCSTTYTIYPGYYIKYWYGTNNQISNSSLVTNLPTTRATAIFHTYNFSGGNMKLYAAIPETFLSNGYNAVFTDGNFDGGFSKVETPDESKSKYSYNGTDVKYNVYVSEQLLSSGTNIGIYKQK